MAKKKILEVPHRPQDQTLWCWAANVEMVSGIPQCVVAQRRFVFDDCDKEVEELEEDERSNQGVNPEEVQGIWAANGIGSVFRPDFVSFDLLESEIDQGRPVQVAWLWDTRGGHVVIVRGYRDDGNGQFLFVNDPLEELDDVTLPIPMSYSDLLTAENQGAWRFTWTSLEKG